MSSFKIKGGKKLHGEIVPQGAKNEALQIICATLLSPEKITIENIPDIRDVNKLIELLQDLGVIVEKLTPDTYTFQAENIDLEYMKTFEYKTKASSLRGSIMILGPLVSRFGKGYIPQPGGDKIGRRRLDTHFFGLQKLGADFIYEADNRFYRVESKRLTGAYMLLDEASVTGTANILMAATLAKGETTIFNAACEPYLLQLSKMLVRMGAKIEGIGSNLLKIEGVEYLGGCTHRMMADMIEVGSFIGMAAMTQSEITIKNVDFEALGIIPEVFSRMGVKIEKRGRIG